MSEAADVIRACVKRVSFLRESSLSTPSLHNSLRWVKDFQSRRFAGTYGDLLNSVEFGAASTFFLQELYGDKDYEQRDAQFARIAGALQKYFPESVVETAVALAELHALTEELDFEMAEASLASGNTGDASESAHYLQCWRMVGRESDRLRQLQAVLNMGNELNRLTQIRGLRMMLRMMRGPAKAAGLHALQLFLESGFDTFATMSGKRGLAAEFLHTIEQREGAWISKLFTLPEEACIADLQDSIRL